MQLAEKSQVCTKSFNKTNETMNYWWISQESDDEYQKIITERYISSNKTIRLQLKYYDNTRTSQSLMVDTKYSLGLSHPIISSH